MGFFGNNKETNDKNQTNEVKDASLSKAGDLSSASNNGAPENLNNPFQSNLSENKDVQNPFNSSPTTIPVNVASQNQPQITPIQQETQPQASFNDGSFEMSNDISQSLSSNASSEGINQREEIQNLIDETVEKVIEEKWEKLLFSVEKVVKWKEVEENEIENLKLTLSNIKENFENLDKKLSSKLSSYDSGLLDINSEIKALEKVFQKITPTLVNNVNELSKIAESIKENTNLKINKDESES